MCQIPASHCFIFVLFTLQFKEKSLDVVLGIRTGAAGWKAKTDPLVYGGRAGLFALHLCSQYHVVQWNVKDNQQCTKALLCYFGNASICRHNDVRSKYSKPFVGG